MKRNQAGRSRERLLRDAYAGGVGRQTGIPPRIFQRRDSPLQGARNDAAFQRDAIQELLSSEESFEEVARFKRAEERERVGSNQADARPGSFAYLSLKEGDSVLDAFSRMQSIYVFDESFVIDEETVMNRLEELRTVFERWS